MSKSSFSKPLVSPHPSVTDLALRPGSVMWPRQPQSAGLTSADKAAMVQAVVQVVPDLLNAARDWRMAARDERLAHMQLQSEGQRVDQADRESAREHERNMARSARADKELEQHGRAVDRTFDVADKLLAAGDHPSAVRVVELALGAAGGGAEPK